MKSTVVSPLTDANYEAEALAAPLPVLIEFGTQWCPPCRQMEPLVEAIAAANVGRLRVLACDIDGNYEVSTRLNVRAAPTFLLLQGGVVVDRIVGAVPRARLDAMVQRALGATMAR